MSDPAFLLDSNICIYLLEGLSARVRARAEQHPLGSLITSTIVQAEVLKGIDHANPSSIKSVEALFAAIPPLPFDSAAAQTYAALPFKRRSFDRLIAAHALSLGFVLVTANGRDFADIPGLQTEDWTQP